MYGQTHIFPLFSPYFASLIIKAVAIVEISSFAYFHIVPMYSHIQIVWLIGIKTNGNYRNFVIFTCFICSIMCYVYSNTKNLLFHHWFGSLAVNTGEIIEISIISHQLSAV